MKNDHFLETDVLIVGGGGAGMRAAIEAASLGCRVIVANKGAVGRSGTTPMAMEAYQAVCSPEDSEEIHFQDTVAGGRELGDENLIRVLVKEARQRAQDLEKYGVRFKKKADGSFDPMHHPGQSFPRTLFIQGGGYGMLAGLVREAKKNSKIKIMSDVLVTKILLDQDRVPCGAIYLDLKDGKVKAIQCPAVILATGGYEELWAFNDASLTACGDGVFLAYEAGAKLVDLEMLLFYPTVVIHPPSVKGTLFQYELVINPEILGGRLLNGRDEPFIAGMPLRDALIRAICQEVKMGRGTKHGGVFIDLTNSSLSRENLTGALEKWQPNQFHYLKDMGVDLREVMVEVAPHAHFTMGGVAVDECARTSVGGLYAAGEVAGNLHGANRVSGNALAETQVFGVRAGVSAATWVNRKKNPGVKEFSAAVGKAEALLDDLQSARNHFLRPWQIRKRLQEIMWQWCGIEREAEGLRRGLAELEKLERESFRSQANRRENNLLPSGQYGAYPQELQDAWETWIMITLGKLVCTSALFREETRGHHIRLDYPAPAEEAVHTFLSKGREPERGKVNKEDLAQWKK